MIISLKEKPNSWTNFFSKISAKYKDVFFNENYLKGILPDLEKNDDIILFANIDEVKNFFWFVVSIKREVPIKGLGKVFYDLETPYGYGGPLTNSNCKNFLLESNLKYFNWMLSNNIIAEFTRFNPLLNNPFVPFVPLNKF